MLASDQLNGLDLRKVYLYLQRATEAKLGMRGPFLGVANRRRIWGVCEQIAVGYREEAEMLKAEDFEGLDGL